MMMNKKKDLVEFLHDDDDDVLELIYKISNDDKIINLKERDFPHHTIDEREIEDSDNENLESLKSNSAYKSFSESLKALKLSSMIKKVNTPKIDQTISVYSHENDMLIHSIALDIAFLLKPLVNMSVNLIKDDDGNQEEEQKIQIVRN